MLPALLLQRISSKLTQLRKSERKVADYVLNHLEEVIHLRIIDLARLAQVSEPTVIRFCRAVGCNGFQDFKMTLALEYSFCRQSYRVFWLRCLQLCGGGCPSKILPLAGEYRSTQRFDFPEYVGQYDASR